MKIPPEIVSDVARDDQLDRIVETNLVGLIGCGRLVGKQEPYTIATLVSINLKEKTIHLLASMPNVGEDQDFAREQAVRRD